VAGNRVLLLALPARTPEDSEIQLLADSLLRNKRAERTIVDLSQLNTISSLFLARLLALNKRLQPHKSRLAVCGATPVVREIFRRTHFDTLLDVIESEPDKVAENRAGGSLVNAIVLSLA
jgi:anti-anti-sigma factor